MVGGFSGLWESYLLDLFDLGYFSNHPDLVLDFGDRFNQPLDPLADKPLQTLIISGAWMQSVGPIGQMTSLTEFRLPYIVDVPLDALASLTSLTHLETYTRNHPLPPLPKLETLKLLDHDDPRRPAVYGSLRSMTSLTDLTLGNSDAPLDSILELSIRRLKLDFRSGPITALPETLERLHLVKYNTRFYPETGTEVPYIVRIECDYTGAVIFE